MNYETENDRRRMLPGPEGSQYWSLTDWYREAVDVFREFVESGDRLMAGGTRPQTRDYFKLTSLARHVVAVRDARDEQNHVRRDLSDADDGVC
jgi:hypothetical protein